MGDEGKALDAVHLTFSKVFNSISCNILADKLMKYGLNIWTERWIENWLSWLWQNTSFRLRSVTTEVLRRSELGQILFWILFSDLNEETVFPQKIWEEWLIDQMGVLQLGGAWTRNGLAATSWISRKVSVKFCIWTRLIPLSRRGWGLISWKSLWQKITLLVDTKLAMSQQCAFVENKKVKHIKSSVRQSTSCRWREVILSLYSSGVLGPVLGSPVQVSHQKTEQAQQRAS